MRTCWKISKKFFYRINQNAIFTCLLFMRVMPTFGSGTVPGCTGIENSHFLISGDSIRLEIKGIGVVENKIV